MPGLLQFNNPIFQRACRWNLIAFYNVVRSAAANRLLPAPLTFTKCNETQQNASKCIKVQQNASKCNKVHQSATKCIKVQKFSLKPVPSLPYGLITNLKSTIQPTPSAAFLGADSVVPGYLKGSSRVVQGYLERG
jgi:hypothetical protein